MPGITLLAMAEITSEQTAWDCSVWYNVVLNTMHYHKHDGAPLSLYNHSKKTSSPFWTTKTAVLKFPQSSGSTPTPCLDKAVHAEGGGGYAIVCAFWQVDDKKGHI